MYKIIPGYPDYKISKAGKIIHRKTHQEVSRFLSPRRRYNVSLWNGLIYKIVSLHRIVCITFHKNPDNLTDVNHKDGNRLNCNSSNLEWMSHDANRDHGYAMGILEKPKMIKQCDLNGNQIEIYPSINSTTKNGFKRSCVQDCLTGRSKTHLGFKFELV